MGVKIVYKNYALVDKSKLRIFVDAKDSNDFRYLDGLKNNDAPSKLASFEEQYMRSDGRYKFSCRDTAETENLGYVSKRMCDSRGVFSKDEEPKLHINIGSTASSDGITLFFSPIEEEYASEVEIIWYEEDAVTGEENEKAKETFYPDKNIFFCPKIVENYSCIDIVFKKWSFGNRWARLYRIDFGREVVYEDDAIFSVSVNESVNLVADQTTVNTSSIVLLTDPDVLFQKQQYFEILYNDTLVARHFVKEIKIQGSKVFITGNDVLSKLDNLIMPTTKGYRNRSFSDWVKNKIWSSDDTEMKDIPLIWNVSNDNIEQCRLNCSFEEGTTKREALTRLCLAAGAYIETAGSRGIVIRATEDALNAAAANAQPVDDEAPPAKIIPETDVFSGDSMEYKEPYYVVAIKYKDAKGSDQYISSDLNIACSDSDAKKEFDLKSIDRCAQECSALANLYSKYYFQTEFYNAKAVIDENINVGNRVLINGKDALVIQRTLNLDGDKIIADGTYKLVKEG